MPLGEMRGIGPGTPAARPAGLSRARATRLLGRGPRRPRQPDRRRAEGSARSTLERRGGVRPPSALARRRIEERMPLGVRALDTAVPCGRGQRLGIFAGSGVGKSSLLGMIAQSAACDVNVICLVGERGREVREFIERDLGDAIHRSVVVVATSDQPALVRIKAALTATTIAEHFRDKGSDVLLMMDSVTRFAMAKIKKKK
jgi:flagellum-specific ATP synthase